MEQGPTHGEPAACLEVAHDQAQFADVVGLESGMRIRTALSSFGQWKTISLSGSVPLPSFSTGLSHYLIRIDFFLAFSMVIDDHSGDDQGWQHRERRFAFNISVWFSSKI